jgi:hypothetical protein
MRRCLPALLLCLPACADPETSRLPAASEAVVYAETVGKVVTEEVDLPASRGLPPFLPVGSRVTVQDDPAGRDLGRKVVVVPRDGPNQGVRLRIERHALRPAPP